MPYTLIKGSIHVVGYQPDGDTIRFKPNDRRHLDKLSGPPAKSNGRGHASLRMEAIDTLETHYEAGGQNLSQPEPFADGATDRLMELAGIRNVVWSNSRRSVVSADDGTEGYVLARSVDKFKRVIAFLFAGSASEADGESVFFDGDRLKQCANYALAKEGLAYPTFYSGLFADLRAVLAEGAADARTNGRGLYAVDKTQSGFEATSLMSITDQIVMMPKLFRRLSTYIVETGTAQGFKTALEANEEPVLDLRTQNITHLDTFIDQTGSTIKLTRAPEELVFDPMPQRTESFADLLAAGNRFDAGAFASGAEVGIAGTHSYGFHRRVQRLQHHSQHLSGG